jgi:hypothetical protein
MRKQTNPKQPQEEIVKITLWLPDQKALNKILASANIHLNCAAPRRENDGTYRIELYASPAESKKLIAMGYRSDVDNSYGKILEARLKEVSKTDRFKGGKTKPTGLGERR